MTDTKMLAELLFPGIDKTPEDYEKIYPERNLGEGAVVTRFSPSPTGFLHFGGLFAAFASYSAAKMTDGVFFLRIEDTDKKREIENGVSLIVKGFEDFGINIDEGMISETDEKGDYGPYIQSRRTHIYQSFVKSLIDRGAAYPCFMTEAETASVREEQEKEKLLPGIYGKFAKYRDMSYDEIKKRIDAGDEYVIRLRSPGKEENRIKFKDIIKGEIEMPENILDIVLLKKDGTPTYHFAHAVDDHLMRTTHVIRGDEWISSVPIHLQLFKICGFKAPKYAHISPIMKEENGGKRKLSKRKDPEAAVSYYSEAGYPKGAVWEYMMTLANSNYEDWRIANPDLPIGDFKFAFSKMSKAGALFDMAKLSDISKTYISKLTADEVFDAVKEWSYENNKKLHELLCKNEQYAKSVFSIERGNEKPRKDIAKWSDVEDYISYFYKELWNGERDFSDNISKDAMLEILTEYKNVYTKETNPENWFPDLRDMAERLGYAKQPKLFKKNPELYRGHVGDVSNVIRAAVTGRRNTPDLCAVMQTLGYDEVMKRLDSAMEYLSEN
ncbi:MAG: glutamate--tRNA ligase [Oscillospiraceae bacterium]|nr:glutamate--tRNA ligase [Oscillospiraceae bacterium]